MSHFDYEFSNLNKADKLRAIAAYHARTAAEDNRANRITTHEAIFHWEVALELGIIARHYDKQSDFRAD
jgi:hypothetical protein